MICYKTKINQIKEGEKGKKGKFQEWRVVVIKEGTDECALSKQTIATDDDAIPLSPSASKAASISIPPISPLQL